MDRGLYSASAGGFLSMKRLDIVANNLANVTTVGYKAERLASRQQEFSDTLAANLPGADLHKGDFERTPGVIVTGSNTDFSNGTVQYTGDPLNVALSKPNQFFTVNTPQGELLTRAGNFHKLADGTLVTGDGMPVNGDGGPINIPQGNPKINPNGVIVVNGKTVGRLKVVQVNDLSSLQRAGGTRFQQGSAQAEAVDNPYLAVESVEMPNVGVVEGMVDMINSSRAFEAYTKIAGTIDQLNTQSIQNGKTTG